MIYDDSTKQRQSTTIRQNKYNKVDSKKPDLNYDDYNN
jgi:hypothetical protein